jgi:hypothetical protein
MCISFLRPRRRVLVVLVLLIVRVLVFGALMWFVQDLLHHGYDATTATSVSLVLLGAAMQASRSLLTMPAAASCRPLLD